MRCYLRLAVVTCFIWIPLTGAAEKLTSLSPSINGVYIHDSNLFRLPDSSGVKSDSVNINTIGLDLKKEISLQKINANISVVDYKYSIFDYLNFTSLNYNANMEWSVTPRLHGVISSSRSETASNFAYNRAFNLPSQQVNKTNRFTTIYDINSSVSFITAIDQTTYTNDQRQMGLSEYKQIGKEVGIRYSLPSGSSITYALNASDGEYLNIINSSSNNNNSKYRQIDNAVRIHWEISPKTRADLNTTYINRTHPNASERNFNGLQSKAALNWDVTGKTSMEVSWSRDYASYQTYTGNPLSDINFAQTDRLSFGPIWKISPKLVARLRYEFAKVDYMGLKSMQRNEKLHDTSFSLQWQATQHIIITAALIKSIRKSDIDFYNFKSNMTSISAQYKY